MGIGDLEIRIFAKSRWFGPRVAYSGIEYGRRTDTGSVEMTSGKKGSANRRNCTDATSQLPSGGQNVLDLKRLKSIQRVVRTSKTPQRSARIFRRLAKHLRRFRMPACPKSGKTASVSDVISSILVVSSRHLELTTVTRVSFC